MPIANLIHLGDCLEYLKSLPDNSIDAIVSDPPYGLGTREPTGEDIDRYLAGEAGLNTGGDFMRYGWEIPSVPTFRECFRVLKPGRHICCFAGTRTFDLMACGMLAAGFIEDGGLAQRFGLPILQWIHGQGFPKSLDIAKAIDKHLGIKREVLGERTVIQGGGTSFALRAGERREVQVQITSATSPEAKKWEGWGTALKPAWEPIICLRKPGPMPEDLVAPRWSFRYCPKITASEADAGLLKSSFDPNEIIEKNTHPTRKPLKIMEWIIGLASREDDIVLDPYCGSGTTCVASILLGRQYIGCELNPEFHKIASARVKHALQQTTAEQRKLFRLMEGTDDNETEDLPPMQSEVLVAPPSPKPAKAPKAKPEAKPEIVVSPVAKSEPPVATAPPAEPSLFDLMMEEGT
jgi:site-specific DNA-methyltransferase (adenine-specific)